ncbi:MAG: hypothetical protein WA977_04390 [Halobacteriota archaeon]
MDEQAIRKILKRYWAEIVTNGLRDFFQNHPKYLVTNVTRGMIREFTKVAYAMMQLKFKGKHLYEWVISEAPLAKDTIEFMFMEGVHGSGFQDWFINDHYPAHIRKEVRRIKPTITGAEFMKIFKEEIPKIILK